jgi:hypothetical protein
LKSEELLVSPIEKNSDIETKHKMDEVKVKEEEMHQLNMENEEEALESETQLKYQELRAILIEKTYRIESKHKREEGEVKEEEGYDEIHGIPSKRSRQKEHEEFYFEKSISHFNQKNGVRNSNSGNTKLFSGRIYPS